MKLEIEKSTNILIDIDQYWSILINSDRWSKFGTLKWRLETEMMKFEIEKSTNILKYIDQYWEPYLGISQGSGESSLPGNRWRNQRERVLYLGTAEGTRERVLYLGTAEGTREREREYFTWELLKEPEREPYLGTSWGNQKRDFSRRSRAQLGECSCQFVSEIEQSWNIGILRLLTAEISTLFDFKKIAAKFLSLRLMINQTLKLRLS